MTGQRHVPLRRCVSCRRSLGQPELTRFRLDPDGRWQLDLSGGRAGGRGAWVCERAECRNVKGLGRFFRAQAARIAEELSTADAPASRDGGMNV